MTSIWAEKHKAFDYKGGPQSGLKNTKLLITKGDLNPGWKTKLLITKGWHQSGLKKHKAFDYKGGPQSGLKNKDFDYKGMTSIWAEKKPQSFWLQRDDINLGWKIKLLITKGWPQSGLKNTSFWLQRGAS